LSTDGPIAYGAIASSNLEIVQSSSGELGGLAGSTLFSQTWQPESAFVLSLNGSTALSLTYGQVSSGSLTLGGSSESAYVTGIGSQVHTFEVSVPLSVDSSSTIETLIVATSTGELTLAGVSQIIFNDLEVSSVELELAGESTVSVSRESSSLGELEIAGSSTYENVQSPESTAPLEFGGTVVAIQIVDAVSTGQLILSGTTDTGGIKDINVVSSGELEIAASSVFNHTLGFTSSGTLLINGSSTVLAELPTITQVTSSGTLLINGSSTVLVELPTITQVTSSGSLLLSGSTILSGLLSTADTEIELEIGINNAYQFNVTPLETVHSGHRGLKDTTQSRQVAYISQVRIARPQVRAEVGFYPAPPAQAETPRRAAPRPQGPFGKFLDQHGNRLTYRYDSSTATVRFGIHSTVEVDNFGMRNRQIQQDDAWLLGFDDDDVMLDSARIQQIIQRFHDEKSEHLRRLQEDKDLLGITD